MNVEGGILERLLRKALSGKGSHTKVDHVFAGIDWGTAGARPEQFPYSLHQLLNHMIYWQEWVLKWLDGERPPVPKHASDGWLGSASPAGGKDWDVALQLFQKGLAGLRRRSRQADLLAKRGRKSRIEMLHAIASHNSYHAGQAALIRRMLGKWPPPSGGVTW